MYHEGLRTKTQSVIYNTKMKYIKNEIEENQNYPKNYGSTW